MNYKPKREIVSNSRIGVQLLGSGWAAIHYVDVEEAGLGKYTDIQQTGIGRYSTKEQAIIEAKQWAEAEEIPLIDGLENT